MSIAKRMLASGHDRHKGVHPCAAWLPAPEFASHYPPREGYPRPAHGGHYEAAPGAFCRIGGGPFPTFRVTLDGAEAKEEAKGGQLLMFGGPD